MKQRPEYDMKRIGRNLKRLRESNRLSVDEVRKYLCLGSVQAVYKYEKGVSCPPADTMFALMELYKAELRDIIGDHETEQSVCSMAPGASDVTGISSEAVRMRQLGLLMRYFKLYTGSDQGAVG